MTTYSNVMKLFMYSRDYLSLHPLITLWISKHKWIKGCICDRKLTFIHLSYLIFLYSKLNLKIRCDKTTFITNIIYDGIELLKSIMKWGHWEKTKAEYNLDLIEYRVYWRREKSSSFGFVGFRWTLKFINHSIQTQNNH